MFSLFLSRSCSFSLVHDLIFISFMLLFFISFMLLLFSLVHALSFYLAHALNFYLVHALIFSRSCFYFVISFMLLILSRSCS